MKDNQNKQKSNLEISNEKIFDKGEFDIGGNWACVIGCGTFCYMGGGATTYIAAAATAL